MFPLQRNQVYPSRDWKRSQRQIIKDADPFPKMFFFCCFPHIFAIAKQLHCFSINRLASVENILMYIYFLNVNICVSISDCLFKYIYLVFYLKFRFYCLTCSVMLNLNSADFTTPNSHQRF